MWQYVFEFGVTIFVGVIILSTITWSLLMIHLGLRFMKIYDFFSHQRLKWKFKGKPKFEDEEIVYFVAIVIKRKWKYRDIKKITKNNPKQDEILYTYMIMSKLGKEYINNLLEGGGQNEERISRFEGKIVEDVTRFANKREY